MWGIWVLAFGIINALQIAFVGALPDPWRLLPLSTTVGLFLLARRQQRTAPLVWCIASSTLIDLITFHRLGLETVFALMACVSVLVMSRLWVTTRSVYGTVLAVVSGIAIGRFVQWICLSFIDLISGNPLLVVSFFGTLIREVALAFILALGVVLIERRLTRHFTLFNRS